MDILSKLPFLNSNESQDEVDVDEAQAKKDRIAFHRDHVRNGPSNFKAQTTGQVRRARQRELNRRTKAGRRQQVRTFLDAQREYAVLTGHLQAVGVLPYATDFRPTEDARLNSVRWIVGHHGNLLLDSDELVRDAIQAAYDRYSALTGQEPSAVEYA